MPGKDPLLRFLIGSRFLTPVILFAVFWLQQR